MNCYTDLKNGYCYHSKNYFIIALEWGLAAFPLLCVGLLLASALLGVSVESIVKDLILFMKGAIL